MALHLCRRDRLADVVALLTTVNAAFDRVSIHGTRLSVLRLQAAALGLPLIEVPLPHPCPNEAYEAAMSAALDRMRRHDATAMVFGDLFLEDVRAYREDRLRGSGLAPVFPLWGRPTADLAHEMIASGLQARIVSCDTRVLSAEYCGRVFDAAFLADLPEGIDPCGERGEFHSCVLDMPGFAAPLRVQTGETVQRDGFAYTDLIPDDSGLRST